MAEEPHAPHVPPPGPPPEPDVPRAQDPVPPAGDDEPQPEDDWAPPTRNVLIRGASAAGLHTGRLVHGTGRRIRRATSAEGAGESGLAKLIELHALNSFGDMLIAIALASTIFFSVPTSEARGRVALYLLVTMAPFTVLAPLIGPLLDRMPHGRRSAMAMSMLARAVLAWTMASTVTTGDLTLYPEALGALVASKSYGVVRSVVVPRLLPHQLSLVKANSRVTLAGLLATGLAAGVGGILHLIGPGWPLRGAFLVFVIGTLMAFHLPHAVDSARGEKRAVLHAEEPSVHRRHHLLPPEMEPTPPRKPVRKVLRTVGPSVILALRAVSALRALVGFLVMFLAFLVREDPVSGVAPTVALGLIAAAAGVGNALGSVFGSWLRTRGSETTVTFMLLLATVACAVAAAWYSLGTLVLVAGVSGMAASLGKLALDALIQRDVPELVRTSAFARSETLLQLCWVAGGGLGIVLPLEGTVGLALAASGVGLMLLWTVHSLWRVGLRGPAARPRAA